MEIDSGSSFGPSQELRDRLSVAIQEDDQASVLELLRQHPLLANADLRPITDRNVFSDGHPLHRACERDLDEIAKLLLQHGAFPDAPGPNPEDRPVHGMPLHFAAADHRNYELAHLLLDHGATPNSYPNCDQATIERMFYAALDRGMSEAMVRRSFARFLPYKQKLEAKSVEAIVGPGSDPAVELYSRMVDLGGQPPFTALVRSSFNDLLMEIIDHCPQQDGTPHDYPRSSVLNNISGAARWFGYPKLVRGLMEHPRFQYEYEDAISTIGTAIGSHNRDGTYLDYRQIIVMQLEILKQHGELQRARDDSSFQPLYQVATDFTWHSNYGYRAEIAKPDCYLDLAELLVAWGLDDVEYRDPETDHSPLSAAVTRGKHPGITTYIRWLLDHGADLRTAAPPEVNPLSIAQQKGLEEIHRLLLSYMRES